MFASRFVRLAPMAAVAALAALFANTAQAAVCVGSCGVFGPDGVVTSPPESPSYRWISTYGGLDGAGQIAGAGGTNGSTYTSSAFTAAAGDDLEFYFNYVTSDGQLSGGTNYEDYTWVELQTDAGDHVAYIFTARTEASGNIVPGQGLPGVAATLDPPSVTIIPGAPDWSPLGPDYNNTCWGPGCGYTGWVKSNFAISEAGDYQLVFGVTNYVDTLWDSGLAFDGLKVAGAIIDDDEDEVGGIPEPGTWALMILGFAGAGAALRRRRSLAHMTAP